MHLSCQVNLSNISQSNTSNGEYFVLIYIHRWQSLSFFILNTCLLPWKAISQKVSGQGHSAIEKKRLWNTFSKACLLANLHQTLNGEFVIMRAWNLLLFRVRVQRSRSKCDTIERSFIVKLNKVTGYEYCVGHNEVMIFQDYWDQMIRSSQ